MKKLVAGVAVAALLGSAAFADVHVGLEGDANINIGNGVNAEQDGTNVRMGVGRDGAKSSGLRSKLVTSASNDYVGGEFVILQDGKNGGTPVVDSSKLWWTPIEQFKMWVGKGTTDDIRGNAGYGYVGFDTPLNVGDYKDAWTFMGQDVSGVTLGVFPIEGLQLYASFGMPMSSEVGEKDDKYYHSDNTTVESYRSEPANVFGRQSRYCMAYDIEGVGTVKLGLDEKGRIATDKDGHKKSQNIISASFELKAVDNLYFALGAFIPTVQYAKQGSSDASSQGSFEPEKSWVYNRDAFNRIHAYLKYTISEGFNIHAKVGTLLNSPDTKEDTSKESGIKAVDGQFGFYVGAGVDYPLMDTVALNLNAAYANGIFMKSSSADHSDCFDVGISIAKTFDNCTVSAGFVGATNYACMYDVQYADKYPFSWGVPLHISYSF